MAKVALEALKERNSIEEIAHKHKLHPNQVINWKKEFMCNASATVEGADDAKDSKDQEEKIDKLHSQFGQLKVKNDWL